MVVTSTICPFLQFSLRVFGVWPDVSFAVVRRLIYVSITFPVLYFQYLYVFMICKSGELRSLIDSLPVAVYYSLTGFKAITVWKYQRVVRELLATVDTDWRECMKVDQHLHIMKTKASISKFCTHSMICFNSFAAFLYFSGDNLVAITQMLRGYNITSRPFPIKLLLPFDAEQSPVYELIVFVLCLHSMSIMYLDNVFSSLILSLVLHACGQIEIMCQELKTISEEIHHYKSTVYTTRMLIQNHNKVILFSENIDRLFSYIVLVQVFGNTLIICFLGFILMISDMTAVIDLLKFVFAYAGMTLEIFIFCLLGEHLGFKSRSLGDAGYNSLWYNMSCSHSKNILFIIMRSQKQLTITAGGMADLSLGTFMSIMKASASYMSVLNAMY